MPKPVSRWWRPAAFGDVWDRMTDSERRSARRSDIFVGLGGALLFYLLLS